MLFFKTIASSMMAVFVTCAAVGGHLCPYPTRTDRQLHGSVYVTLHPGGEYACHLTCWYSSRCASFNWDTRFKVCQLCDSSEKMQPWNLRTSPGIVYGEPRRCQGTGHACADRPCRVDEMCMPAVKATQHICLSLESLTTMMTVQTASSTTTFSTTASSTTSTTAPSSTSMTSSTTTPSSTSTTSSTMTPSSTSMTSSTTTTSSTSATSSTTTPSSTSTTSSTTTPSSTSTTSSTTTPSSTSTTSSTTTPSSTSTTSSTTTPSSTSTTSSTKTPSSTSTTSSTTTVSLTSTTSSTTTPSSTSTVTTSVTTTTKPPLTSTTASSTTTISYVEEGCYSQSNHDRVLPTDDDISSSVMTIPMCSAHCKALSKPYIALHKGKECSCGSTLDTSGHTLLADSECNTACSGDDSTFCGATWKVSVFKNS